MSQTYRTWKTQTSLQNIISGIVKGAGEQLD